MKHNDGCAVKCLLKLRSEKKNRTKEDELELAKQHGVNAMFLATGAANHAKRGVWSDSYRPMVIVGGVKN